MRLLFIYLIVAVELVVATASSARTVNWGAKSALIDLGMTEQQVTKTVGSAPSADYSWRRGFLGGERRLNRPAHV